MLLFLLAWAHLALAAPLAKRYSKFQQTSAVFSLVAYHKGLEFQYNLVKFNGRDLELARDAPAFFGRVKASTGYTLNIPMGTDSPYDLLLLPLSPPPQSTSVFVDDAGKLTTLPGNASTGFAIDKSKLAFHNSSLFAACPVWTTFNTTWAPSNTTWTPHGLPSNDSAWSLPANSTWPPHWSLDWSVDKDWLFFANTTGFADASDEAQANITEWWLRRYDTFNIYAGTACPDSVPGYNISLVVQLAAAVQYTPESNVDSFVKRFVKALF